MLTQLLQAWGKRLSYLFIAFVSLVGPLLPLAPAHAEAPPANTAPIVQELSKELESLQTQQGIYTVQQARRLADLSRLDSAITNANDRSTVANTTDHNLGVFVRSKRQREDQPATFVVLGPGHETDDDIETIALFIPANVPVSWPGRSPETGATPARVLPLLPGEQLLVRASEGSSGYFLNLPAFALETERADLGSLPTFRQEDLDTQPETAPVD